MSLAYFIAQRYFLRRKRFHAVQVVSAVSSIAVGVVVMAVVVILSIYNGYEEILLRSASCFDAPLRIERSDGVAFDVTAPVIEQVRRHPKVFASSRLVRGEGIFGSASGHIAAHLLGVEASYPEFMHLDTLFLEGDFSAMPHQYALGAGLYKTLGTGQIRDSLTLYIPKRRGYINPLLPHTAFQYSSGTLTAVLTAEEERYDRTAFLSADELASLLELSESAAHALAIMPTSEASIPDLKKSLQEALGADWCVLDRKEQQPDLLRLVAIEKWLTFLILFFVLLLAAFNVICSSSMLIIEKRHDVAIYTALGARFQMIRSIFLWQGFLVTLVGAVGGFLFGLLLVFLQSHFGWISFGEGIYRLPYPVVVQWGDPLSLVVVVILIGYLSAFYPVLRLLRSTRFDQ